MKAPLINPIITTDLLNGCAVKAEMAMTAVYESFETGVKSPLSILPNIRTFLSENATAIRF